MRRWRVCPGFLDIVGAYGVKTSEDERVFHGWRESGGKNGMRIFLLCGEWWVRSLLMIILTQSCATMSRTLRGMDVSCAIRGR